MEAPKQSDLSILKVVRVGKPLRQVAPEAILGPIRDALEDVVRRLRLLDYESPRMDRIEAGLLTVVLDQEIGGHILGITNADLVDEEGGDFHDFMFGGKDNRNDVAVVSTRRIASSDPGRALARLLKVSLHELGHNFGLVHHYGFALASDGGYCPMTKGEFNRHGERSYIRSVIDARGFRFCDACRSFLRSAHGR